MSSGKILTGVLAGMAAGVLIGVLFAPDKGSRTRRRLLAKGENYGEELRDQFNEYYEAIADKRDSIIKEGEELMDKGKAKFQAAKNKEKENTEIKHGLL